jgi:hypothetical protein
MEDPMTKRLLFIFITGFWLVMTYMLWRAELGTRHQAGTSIPLETVWKKVLLSPDQSALEIWHRDKRLGDCRWAANVGEDRLTGRASSDEALPEGMVHGLSGYTLDLDGNVMLKELGSNVRFYAHLGLSTNQVWKDINIRINLRTSAMQVIANAAEEKVTLRIDDENGTDTREFTFKQLNDPQEIARTLGGPLAGAMVGSLGLPKGTNSLEPSSLDLKWSAHNDSLRIGRSSIRVFRLQASLLGRYQVVVYVSRAGEILRVELPDNLVLINYALANT